MKELVPYTGFYVERALKDAALSGLPLTLRNFNDSIMETKHKEAKQGNHIYSSGRVGETGKIDYQNEHSPNNSVTSGHPLRTERKKGAASPQTLKSTKRKMRIYQNI